MFFLLLLIFEYLHEKSAYHILAYRCFLLLLRFHFLKKTYAYNSLLIKTIMTMTTTTSTYLVSMMRSYVTFVYLFREMMLECAVTFRHV